MILYDKKGNFLGMDQKELSSLGFQDFEEFKSYCSDPADMFISRPGYISKFKNFSWIDYAMHSGVPNKNIIIKNKNGKELQAELHISEIFLINKLEDESDIYYVEIRYIADNHNNNIKMPNINFNMKNANETDTDVSFDNVYQESAQESTASDNEIKPEAYTEQHIEIEDFQEDYSAELESIPPIDIKNDLAEDTDEEILQETTDIETEEFEPNVKLKIDFDDDDDDSEELKDLSDIEIKDSDANIHDKENISDQIDVHEDFEELDFTQIADDTGISLEDIAMFINEFIEESKNVLKNINESQTALDTGTLKSKIVTLKGIVMPLKIHSIIKTLDLIIDDIDKNGFSDKLKLFEAQIKDLEEKLF